jgi:hypothetical protein
MLSMMRKRRGFIKAVLWILVVIIAVGLIAYFGNFGFQPPQPAPAPGAQNQQAAF